MMIYIVVSVYDYRGGESSPSSRLVLIWCVAGSHFVSDLVLIWILSLCIHIFFFFGEWRFAVLVRLFTINAYFLVAIWVYRSDREWMF